MIRSFAPTAAGLARTEGIAPAALWLDLSKPADSERAEVSALIGRQVPSLEDQEEIEHSSRLYLDEGVPVMTALLPIRVSDNEVLTAPVTFMLTPERLVTIRHHPHGAFRTYPDTAARGSLGASTPTRILVGLLEAVVDRLADFTELTGRQIEAMTAAAFHIGPRGAQVDHNKRLREIGRQDTIVMHLRESLLSVDRLLGFLQPFLTDAKGKDEARRAIKSCQRDVRTISEQASFLTQKTALLLDATLGMIDLEQNHIAKIFSIVATVFLPPTLIASIFGMNFAYMPILEWRWGYPVCILLMVLAAVAPIVWFKRKGWL